jgi:NhaP-type Na+/H+ or K+/H+ antiporter
MKKYIFCYLKTGFLISVALTTLAVMYWYENDIQTCWTWDQAVLYSAVVSATDPVSVVSLLKTMTSLKTLSTVIEGESVSLLEFVFK